MNKLKHTPGPWRVINAGMSNVVAPPVFVASIAAENVGLERARVQSYNSPDDEWDYPPEQAEADTYLIAAAPDMLEALEAVAHYIECTDAKIGSESLIFSAIAKAKGEA